MHFTFDVERTLDAMAYASTVDLMAGQVTLYGVVCIGSGEEPHFSHGGQLTLDPNQAIEGAQDENHIAFEAGQDCRYLPMAVGVNPDSLASVLHALGHPFEEPEL
jgi:hypothetical protein